jgi:hypothetical protein
MLAEDHLPTPRFRLGLRFRDVHLALARSDAEALTLAATPEGSCRHHDADP